MFENHLIFNPSKRIKPMSTVKRTTTFVDANEVEYSILAAFTYTLVDGVIIVTDLVAQPLSPAFDLDRDRLRGDLHTYATLVVFEYPVTFDCTLTIK